MNAAIEDLGIRDKSVLEQAAWAESLDPVLRPLIYEFILQPSTVFQDQVLGSDLVIRGGAAADRKRASWHRDVTFRVRGNVHEIDKLIRGKVRWYFFSWWQRYPTDGPSEFVVLDMARLLEDHNPREWPVIENHDGKTAFAYRAVDDLGDCVVVRKKWDRSYLMERCDSHFDRSTWVDEVVGGRVRTACSVCGVFIGYRNVD